jgi:hypothetical protein
MPMQKQQEQQELARLKKALSDIRADPEGAEEVLDALDAQLGDNATTPLTLVGIERGDFSDSELADRGDELRALLSGETAPIQPRTADDIRSMTAEQIAALPGGSEQALTILNGEAQ